MVGDEVGAAGFGEFDVGCDGVVADGAADAEGDGEIAAEAGVVGEDEAAEAAELGVAPVAVEIDGDFGEGVGAEASGAERAFDADGAGVAGGGVGADGVGFEPEIPAMRLGQREREVGVGEGEGSLFLAELEVEAGASGFDVGETAGWTGEGLGGGRGLDVRGLKENGLRCSSGHWERGRG